MKTHSLPNYEKIHIICHMESMYSNIYYKNQASIDFWIHYCLGILNYHSSYVCTNSFFRLVFSYVEKTNRGNGQLKSQEYL